VSEPWVEFPFASLYRSHSACSSPFPIREKEKQIKILTVKGMKHNERFAGKVVAADGSEPIFRGTEASAEEANGIVDWRRGLRVSLDEEDGSSLCNDAWNHGHQRGQLRGEKKQTGAMKVLPQARWVRWLAWGS
jgi:hypothetical protein